MPFRLALRAAHQCPPHVARVHAVEMPRRVETAFSLARPTQSTRNQSPPAVLVSIFPLRWPN